MNEKRVVLATVAGLLAASSASATTYIGYTSMPNGTASGDALAARNSFVAALATTGTDDLERFTAGTRSPLTLQFGGLGVTANVVGNGRISTGLTGTFPTSGTKDLLSYGGFSVTFSAPVDGFGFYVSDVADLGKGLKVRYNTGVTTEYVISDANTRPDGSLFFFGVIADAPISSVTFSGSAGSDGVGYDDFIVGSLAGAVPEPATWAMMIGGVGMIGGALRRRRQAVNFKLI